ncbi:hypothetical protein BDN72DRAFT_157564 [Pluteus cervinus]|uniref:Uncharacterized protein n=1 Tax=Pluteus cervinus TaxID=181527 RepID=A0ACD3AKJ9_9AGAR|nr:hypothetical protein BDN72DRAFT_157564 [Pluteus cervinus]
MATDELVKSHPIPDAAYYIRSKATQKVLGLTSSDAVLMQDKADDDDGQKWIFTKRGEIDKKKGIYSIANLERQNVRLGFGSQSANARVEGKDDLVTWTVWVSKNNTFQFNTGNPVFVIEAGSSGSRVTLQDEEGTTHQQWEIIVVKDTAENANTTTGTVHAKISTGQKYFIRNWHNSLLLSIGNKSANSIATNEIYAGNQTQKKMDPKAPVGQIWSVNHKGDGSYEIYNTAARQYLSFADGKNTAYSDLIGSQEPTKWCLNSVGGFAWVITSPESKLCVGFPNPTPHDNDKAFLVPDIITQNKIWFFEDATDAMTSLADKIAGIQVSRLSFTSAITPRNYRIRNEWPDLVQPLHER